MTFTKGLFLLLAWVTLQSLLGRWMIWSPIVPEGDLASLVLLSLAMGRTKGAFYGVCVGMFREVLSYSPGSFDTFVLVVIGFVSGFLGEQKRLPPWQKCLYLFGVVLVSDIFLLSPLHFSAYAKRTLPTAFLTTCLGCFLEPYLK